MGEFSNVKPVEYSQAYGVRTRTLRVLLGISDTRSQLRNWRTHAEELPMLGVCCVRESRLVYHSGFFSGVIAKFCHYG